jgi:hypothetical protein
MRDVWWVTSFPIRATSLAAVAGSDDKRDTHVHARTHARTRHSNSHSSHLGDFVICAAVSGLSGEASCSGRPKQRLKAASPSRSMNIMTALYTAELEMRMPSSTCDYDHTPCHIMHDTTTVKIVQSGGRGIHHQQRGQCFAPAAWSHASGSYNTKSLAVVRPEGV